jgi:ribosomal protein L7/L12
MTSHDVIVFLLGALAASILRAMFSKSQGPVARPPTMAPLASSPDIEMLLRQGKKIEAIKVYREQTGVGLKDAKDAVEEMERRLM